MGLLNLFKGSTTDNATVGNLEDMFNAHGLPGFPLQGITSPFSDLGVAASVTHGFHAMINSPLAPVGASSFSIDVMRLCPFFVPKTIHADQIAFIISIVGGAGAKARMGVYNGALTPPYFPTTLVVDGGEFDATALNGKITATDLVLFGGRMYWGAYLPGTAAPTVLAVANSFSHPMLGYQISAAAATATGILGLALAQAYGALPANLPASPSAYSVSGNVPALFYRHN